MEIYSWKPSDQRVAPLTVTLEQVRADIVNYFNSRILKSRGFYGQSRPLGYLTTVWDVEYSTGFCCIEAPNKLEKLENMSSSKGSAIWISDVQLCLSLYGWFHGSRWVQ